MWHKNLVKIEEKPYFGISCPQCSESFYFYSSGTLEDIIKFIEDNVKAKKTEGTKLVYSCPFCNKSGVITPGVDFAK